MIFTNQVIDSLLMNTAVEDTCEPTFLIQHCLHWDLQWLTELQSAGRCPGIWQTFSCTTFWIIFPYNWYLNQPSTTKPSALSWYRVWSWLSSCLNFTPVIFSFFLFLTRWIYKKTRMYHQYQRFPLSGCSLCFFLPKLSLIPIYGEMKVGGTEVSIWPDEARRHKKRGKWLSEDLLHLPESASVRPSRYFLFPSYSDCGGLLLWFTQAGASDCVLIV